MRILKKRNILKLAATFMLVGMMAGAFAMQAKAAVATTCDTSTSSGGICTSDLTASLTDPALTFTASAFIVTNPHIGVSSGFSLPATVVDGRTAAGESGMTGWQLQAASPGLDTTTPSLGTLIPLNLTGETISAMASTTDCTFPTTSAKCTGVNFSTRTSLTTNIASPVTIATETIAGGGDAGDGTFTLAIPGTFTIPGNDPVGGYTAQITLSLLNTAS